MRKTLMLWLVIGSLGAALAQGYSYSDLVHDLEKGAVRQVVIDAAGNAEVQFKTAGRRSMVTVVPTSSDFVQLVRKSNAELTVRSGVKGDFWVSLLQWLPFLVGIGFMFLIWRSFRSNVSGGSSGAAQFSKSRAHVLTEGSIKLTFSDVAGCEEAKYELQEVVEFLRNPERFHALGARIPHGILLVGPPGSGKTLLAKAVAGEARVPFFSISGSDFVEMFVGVGAARVRDLFEQAKKAAPCIVFIDEIDAVGRKRGLNVGGGNDEREQTLNQLLVEMDGFESKHDIIILAATNRPDVLDNALLRPGRFDRQVVVDAPDVKGREQILRIHARKKPLDPSVDLHVVATRTPGMVGADLENLLNEAALITARAGRKRINMKDIDEAADRVVMGPARKSRVISDKDKKVTAYHEVGHALAAEKLPNADRVHKLTIVPRGRAAGYMMPMPEDRMHYSQGVLEDMIAVALAGQVAEEIIFGEITTGASSDFQKATNIARKMVTEWGMSPLLGKIAHQVENETYLGGYQDARNYSQETAELIDNEIKRIIDEQYTKVKSILEEYKPVIHTVVETLMTRETLSGEEFRILLKGGQLPDQDESDSTPPQAPNLTKPATN
ncbi:ATP-dependent zinc metalloprotease FtsH [Deinococcus cellulosilyticus]|uniref:ATP-dependent zinc metalloprotease FtsH n=1 Tax=Deinococcus cellulosilyticus (strain DSM 18568 / NBRC 106333 / KACC 11606 / 5516J-15) TaxID=1223518 RepID=A0A511N173_DEIC1|nr:ATP-dependent zinc metalloprotease FtsH [Deinococcus cellulosilyticus]GEM46549.1 ATP-dependent zinc metalloprotease FtsH [Deinococcus cellulosilyticus NBRC 106333 = KACC 11606]